VRREGVACMAGFSSRVAGSYIFGWLSMTVLKKNGRGNLGAGAHRTLRVAIAPSGSAGIMHIAWLVGANIGFSRAAGMVATNKTRGGGGGENAAWRAARIAYLSKCGKYLKQARWR